ncbi:MAG: hypothetical protein H6524_15470 [Actinobacteria bacterium]|nr:hypothetical protein [Micrococcales bacterium]MCB0904608.1 hypothetical protein [Actinomycetota bacterium]MCB9430198.1 hypothetical protein [Actinomycetota bacterium]HPJ20514.1 hypothetical protein [Actinomycetota bacterium]HPQ85896.1 hypothetical protein [Actinomycetota bacterium]
MGGLLPEEQRQLQRGASAIVDLLLDNDWVAPCEDSSRAEGSPLHRYSDTV